MKRPDDWSHAEGREWVEPIKQSITSVDSPVPVGPLYTASEMGAERDKLRAIMTGMKCKHIDQFVENAGVEECLALGKRMRERIVQVAILDLKAARLRTVERLFELINARVYHLPVRAVVDIEAVDDEAAKLKEEIRNDMPNMR